MKRKMYDTEKVHNNKLEAVCLILNAFLGANSARKMRVARFGSDFGRQSCERDARCTF